MSVMDSVDKYRHGVLIGNFVEDKFGRDLAEKGPAKDALKLTTTKQVHDITHSLYQPHPVISKQQPCSTSFHQTSKSIGQHNYQRPENQTSYHIFHRHEVTPHIPVLQNDPKKEGRAAQQGKLYNETRNQLANKFGASGLAASGSEWTAANEPSKQSLRESGNIYDLEGQEIPDILTGEIYKPAYRRPDSEVYQPSRHKGEPTTKITSSVAPKSINPYGATTVVKPEVAKFDQQMYRRYVLPNAKGQERDILFGHGLEINQFQRRQLATTYDLSFNQRVMPQTQVNSFYNVNAGQTAKKFHRDTLYEKSHQEKIPEYGTKTLLGQEKVGRPYEPYTKTFDQSHLKNQYLRR